MDLLSQAWRPQCDLVMLFDMFLPQLLVEPNNEDPLNIEAARQASDNMTKYKVLWNVTRKVCSKPFENMLLIHSRKVTLLEETQMNRAKTRRLACFMKIVYIYKFLIRKYSSNTVLEIKLQIWTTRQSQSIHLELNLTEVLNIWSESNQTKNISKIILLL
jgi:Ubiquitin-conjugating enzyme